MERERRESKTDSVCTWPGRRLYFFHARMNDGGRDSPAWNVAGRGPFGHGVCARGQTIVVVINFVDIKRGRALFGAV